MQSIKSVIKVESSLERIDCLLQEISNCDDYYANILKLERVVNEINQYYFHSKQCDSFLNRNTVRVSAYIYSMMISFRCLLII